MSEQNLLVSAGSVPAGGAPTGQVHAAPANLKYVIAPFRLRAMDGTEVQKQQECSWTRTGSGQSRCTNGRCKATRRHEDQSTP
jgi:hypothetical protein